MPTVGPLPYGIAYLRACGVCGGCLGRLLKKLLVARRGGGACLALIRDCWVSAPESPSLDPQEPSFVPTVLPIVVPCLYGVAYRRASSLRFRLPLSLWSVRGQSWEIAEEAVRCAEGGRCASRPFTRPPPTISYATPAPFRPNNLHGVEDFCRKVKAGLWP